MPRHTTFRTTFTMPYDQFREREGESFHVVGAFTGGESGCMWTVAFPDGVTIEAWPEEVEACA